MSRRVLAWSVVGGFMYGGCVTFLITPTPWSLIGGVIWGIALGAREAMDWRTP